MQKRYILLSFIILIVSVLIWNISNSYSIYDSGFSGQDIVSGSEWGVNVVNITNKTSKGQAALRKDIEYMGTTLGFNVSLFNAGDEYSFDIEVENTAKLSAELYGITLLGLSETEAQDISFEVLPLDYIKVHETNSMGSIIKAKEKQYFRVNVRWDTPNKSVTEYNLNLGISLIYKQI